MCHSRTHESSHTIRARCQTGQIVRGPRAEQLHSRPEREGDYHELTKTSSGEWSHTTCATSRAQQDQDIMRSVHDESAFGEFHAPLNVWMVATIFSYDASSLRLACSSSVARVASLKCFSKCPARVVDTKGHLRKCHQSCMLGGTGLRTIKGIQPRSIHHRAVRLSQKGGALIFVEFGTCVCLGERVPLCQYDPTLHQFVDRKARKQPRPRQWLHNEARAT